MADEQDRSPWIGSTLSWDEELAGSLLDAYVIVGITYLKADGSLDEQIQMHGRVSVAEAERGICIALEGKRVGESYWLPPVTRSFAPAPPGEYRLRSTDEVIVDPDFTSSWTITRPPKQ